MLNIAGYSVSVIRLDLPLPETPVIAINLLSGKSTVRFFRLCPLAPIIVKFLPLPVLGSSFGVNFFFPLKYWQVSDSQFFKSAGDP
jgi:hypothetical protein